MRSQHTVNTVSMPLSDPASISFCAKNNIEMSDFTHYIFGGEVEDKKQQIRVASDDLVIIEQVSKVESRFVQISGEPDNEAVPRCAQLGN